MTDETRDALAAIGRDYSATQIKEARRLIETGGVTPKPDDLYPGTHLVRAGDGDGRHAYRTRVDSCTCEAFRHGRRCKHQAAVEITLLGAAVADEDTR